MKEIELLAPAGDLEKLKVACLYGADAVYCSLKMFGLRANALNFTWEDLRSGVKFAHQLHKKVYVTINIVFHEKELKELDFCLQELAKIGIDAIIVSDLLVIRRARKLKVKYDIHVSTQASILNEGSAWFYKKYGVTRCVLAREASLEDIKAIKENTGLEVECFVHGAMCTSFSGRCVLSNYCTNRDANRGGCAQICRWMFQYDDEKQPFSMTPKDLNLIQYIKSLMAISVDSLKIEGRMRGIYYIATVVLAYRRMIDKIKDNTFTESDSKYYLAILNRCANRESTPQFIDGLPTRKEQYFLGRDEVSNQDFLGIVLTYNQDTKMVTIEERNYFKVGDVVEFFGPNHETYTYKITEMFDEEDNLLTIANHPGMKIKLSTDFSLEYLDMMRIKVFDKQNFL